MSSDNIQLIPDERGRFKHGTSRYVELSLQQELDSVALKSINDLKTNLDAKNLEPLPGPVKTTRQLAPEFVPQRVREKRKTQPVFHDDLQSKAPRDQSPGKPVDVPAYNPLNKYVSGNRLKDDTKVKKFPFNKDTTVTTQEMKQPHITSVGIIPTRESKKGGLSVLLEGSKAIQIDQDPVIGPIERANTGLMEPEVPGQSSDLVPDVDGPSTEREDVTKKKVKPAIIPGQGTLGSVSMVQRPPPQPKARSRLKPRHQRITSADSVASSLRSVEIHLPQQEGEGAIPEDQASRGSSVQSVKSVKDLLEEAKQISTPEEKAYLKKRRERDVAKGKQALDVKAQEKKRGTTPRSARSDRTTKKSAERTVDQIISSLKDQSVGAGVSEADRKIQEIMDKVLTRTTAVLTDLGVKVDEEPQEPDTLSERLSLGDQQERTSRVSSSLSSSVTSLLDQTDDLGGPSRMKTTDGEEEQTTEGGGDDETERMTTTDIETPAVIQEALEKLEEQTEKGRSDASKEQSGETATRPAPSSAPPDLELQEKEKEMLDLKQYYEDMQAPKQVTYEDILSIQAQTSQFHPRESEAIPEGGSGDPLSRPATATLLSSWAPVDEDIKPSDTLRKPENSMHHFCTMTSEFQLPDHLRGTWRRCHIQSKYGFLPPVKEEEVAKSKHPTSMSDYRSLDEAASADEFGSSESPANLDRIQSAAARRILDQAKMLSDDAAYEELRSQAEQLFQPTGLEIEGQRIIPKSDESFMHWTPAPPKWDVAPNKVKETLFPTYGGAALAAKAEATQILPDESDESEEEEDEVMDDLDPEDRMARDRVLSRKYGSATDLTALMQAQQKWDDTLKAGGNPEAQLEPSESVWTITSDDILARSGAGTSRTFSGRPPGLHQSDLDSVSEAGVSDISSLPPPPQISFADLRAKFSQQAIAVFDEVPIDPELSISGLTEPEVLPLIVPAKRRASAPGVVLHDEDDEDFLLVFEDFNTAMEEINKQKKLLKMAKKEKTIAPSTEEAKSSLDQAQIGVEMVVDESLPVSPTKPSIFDMKKDDEPTPAELALAAGRAYVLLPPKKKKKRNANQMNVDMLRVEAIQAFLDKPGRKISRADSLTNIEMQPDWEFRVPVRIREKRGSVPNLLQVEPYLKKKGYRKDFSDEEDVREFVRDIWNKWFDQIFPPTPAESDWESDDEYEDYEEQPEQEETKRKGSVASTVVSEGIDLDPVIEDEEDMENMELMQEEVGRLTKVMEDAETPGAFNHARRGALFRKLGKFKSAQDDLDEAIKLEPLLMDAYWHRHLLAILLNNKRQALDDLNFILKHNKTHKGAFRSRANIYRQAGDLTMAIINYSQAIKLNPDDYDAYYQRAHMYEQRGEMLLAMEDYAQATRLMPSKTDALFKHGLHYFKNGNWQLCVNDFTDLLKQEPMNAAARIYRGRAFSKMKLWTEAVEDLSAGIHLNPTNGGAFYYRGCILRKLHPKRALQDFSISLMIDDSEENLLSYLHRGILYNEIGRHEDAIPDFEAVLKLDKDMAVAHVNLGLIYMLKMENYHRAVKKFTQAIKSDPTYVKAYVCRAEAYSRVHDTKNALTDFTRAIHLRPDVNHYYMYRGQLVLRMGNLELAAFCVKHAAEMNAGLGHSPTQQAIVQSFLKNYSKAIDALKAATRSKPVASLFLLLGKTQMKARLWKDAVESFERALEIMKPWNTTQYPPEAAEMYYLIGMCQIETREYLNAHDAFNSAIRVDQRSADAFYYRGMVRMRLKQSKGIQDFNRALSIDPKLFQAYLSRAAFYGSRSQYTKAILNCNEAIKLQPQSVRAYLYRGALKYHIRAYKLAILDLSQAASIENKCALAYFNRAVCYQDSGQHQKALQDYGIVLLLGESLQLKVLINRGLLYFDRKDYHNALYDFLAAAENNPRDKKIYHTLGLCYHKLWRLKDAVTSFTKALKLDPFFLDAYIGRGNVFMDYGNEVGHAMARRDYTRCLHLDPCCVSARVNLGYSLQVMGRYQLAWHQFTTAININPRYKPALEGRAIINLQMSNTFAAFQDISASISVKPTAELLTNRGVIYQFMGDRVNAMRDYQAALKEDTTYALAYFNAGNVYFHMRQFKQALAYYHQALQFNPKDESAILNRAIVKVLLRDSSSALRDFDKAISMSPHSAHMYFNRGNLYLSLKQYEQAESDYTKALELQPDDALVLKRRADVLGKLARKEEAVRDYERAIEIQTMRKR